MVEQEAGNGLDGVGQVVDLVDLLAGTVHLEILADAGYQSLGAQTCGQVVILALEATGVAAFRGVPVREICVSLQVSNLKIYPFK